jgi:hypothetical protein
LSFTALLANADAATFNLLRRGWSIPSDNIDRSLTALCVVVRHRMRPGEIAETLV